MYVLLTARKFPCVGALPISAARGSVVAIARGQQLAAGARTICRAEPEDGPGQAVQWSCSHSTALGRPDSSSRAVLHTAWRRAPSVPPARSAADTVVAVGHTQFGERTLGRRTRLGCQLVRDKAWLRRPTTQPRWKVYPGSATQPSKSRVTGCVMHVSYMRSVTGVKVRDAVQLRVTLKE